MRIEQPFHDGELQVQARTGESEEALRNGRVLSDEIMPGAIRFIRAQQLVTLGRVDKDGSVWSSMLFGTAGFASAPDQQHVEFDLDRCFINEGDPFWHSIDVTARIGALFLEFGTRRRLRINGTITRTAPDRLVLDVAECFPNCPKYIQRRELRVESPDAMRNSTPSSGESSLSDTQSMLVQDCDTFFVASVHSELGIDVSHRGGPPGFVTLLDDRTLRIPDYVGNSMFNTLGNLSIDPRCGLVLLDHDRNRVLQLTGRAEILWDQSDERGATGGTGRFWEFHIDRVLESDSHPGVRWEFVDYSPHNPS